LAKPKTKAAVKKKPAKTQARAAAPAKAPKKAAVAKPVAKPAKSSAAKAAKTAIAKTVTAKSLPAKTETAKTITAKAPVAVAAEVKPVARPRVQEKAEVLTLPTARQAEPAASKPEPAAPKPAPVVRKAPERAASSTRADLPPADGFTLLVDGHFKNQFGDLKGAKAAASELKTRFPMLRIEIYDAASKARLPA
jgi:hypothetical protein